MRTVFYTNSPVLLSFTTLGRFHKLRPVHLIIGFSPPPGSPQATPIAMSVAGQKYHYRLMRLWRNSRTVWSICSPSLFLDQMDPLAPLSLAAFIKSEKNSPKRKNPFAWICSDLTGGHCASTRVAYPFSGSSANVFMKPDIHFSRFK